ncbi:MAG: nucleotidyl transferase AbiEii/AbiGii toxin family protein [Methanosarcinales archaeon]|jgi:predicted nucleotidyltransferase component of viral defense system|nr:nucleotidyl transferase AbiEii/AbiGii toxin family protein [Methanosarcinales archaeon]
MHNIATGPADERKELFRETAAEMGIPEAIIEKDFWVCWVLDYLFHRCEWKENLAFKGGTSLSKAYSLIERFSEDIDLILDWRVLGYAEKEPYIKRSRTEQDRFNTEMERRTIDFLDGTFIPAIKKDIEKELKEQVRIYKNPTEPQTVNIAYPKTYSDDSVLKEIKLEIGARALWTPVHKRKISPYSAQTYKFENPETEITTVTAERTFWEKLTILHHEANRPQTSPLPARYSRHYYDVYKLSRSPVKSSAFDQKELLGQVAEFKNIFYYRSWAHYEEAKIGTLKLIPPQHNLQKLKEDYTRMQNMLFGENKPSFSEITESIKELENEINQL